MSVAVDFTADSDSDSDKDLQEEGIDIVTPRIASSITNTNTNSSKRGTGDLGKLLPNTDGSRKYGIITKGTKMIATSVSAIIVESR
eukprot:CAMPEP_0174988662 /NCGR_PEP_ID=MMETSP0004_2-20121128/20261_1 /TAXON_ID=420556 /ORGANISM="Ochromonas sp., Strain CCMP1393" /LENGTH=85 /DNA_ID=CAMNT_0016241925 /DNA_START=268 /DNA_END=526 /DNA_ORIENTATION=+